MILYYTGKISKPLAARKYTLALTSSSRGKTTSYSINPLNEECVLNLGNDVEILMQEHMKGHMHK